ncbi:MAG: asparagine--tRNA ligase [Nanoarchaeota archaeon]|nr:asparagine--tRNA ligase [Nanoarchaeota archaeon]
MKKLFIKDIKNLKKEFEILGWIKSKRKHKDITFLDLVDSTGEIQVLLKEGLTKNFKGNQKISLEAAVKINGKIKNKILEAKEVKILADSKLNLSPNPRSDFDILDKKYVDFVLTNRHLYLRNPKLMAIMRIRNHFFYILRNWFNSKGIIEFTAPILTQIPLYEEKTAFQTNYFGKNIFLTQCVAFYLEAAVLAFEKVYNIGPSFRAEQSSTKRHLSEYWHVKVELAWANHEEMVNFSEEMIDYLLKNLTKECSADLKFLGVKRNIKKMKIPYPRITYDEALKKLKEKGVKLKWGKSLGADEESILSEDYESPFWVFGIPKEIEPFPYELNEKNKKVTKVADLLLPKGYGELLGTAEKICNKEKMISRMKEEGVWCKKERYDWYVQLRDSGCVIHSGLGMGVERFLRWFVLSEHVRDTIPFPRLFRRTPKP